MITIKLFEDTSAEQAKINCHLEESGGHADKSGLGPGVFNGPTPPPDTAKVLVKVFGPNTICTRHKSCHCALLSISMSLLVICKLECPAIA